VLRVIILSDGRPGHFHLSEGIAAAIQRLRPIQLEQVETRRRGWPGSVVAGMVNSGVPPERILKPVYGLVDPDFPGCDLIVSAGAETLGANVCLSRLRKVPNIFYGSLRAFRPRDFALVLTSYLRAVGRPQHALALKPSALDPDTLPQRTRIRPRPGRPPSIAGLLIGGNTGGFTYNAEDWRQLFDFAAAARRRHHMTWIVSNSRRTPAHVSDELSARAQLSGNGISFIDARNPNAKGLSYLFGEVDAVVCTDDSSTMVSEGVWARLPVLGVRPAQYRFTADEHGYRAFLAENRWYRSVGIGELTPDLFLDELGAMQPMSDNPLDRLAALLRERLPVLSEAADQD
jgi:uncharacterized protein